MQGELWLKACQLEGSLFKLQNKLDKETNLNSYIETQKEIERTTIQLTQYRMIIEQLQKDEALKRIKRKMMR